MQQDRDAAFMGLALAQSERAAARGQTPFGAVVVDPEGAPGGLVVGEGHNQVRADRDPSAHSEVMALRAAWRRLGSAAALRRCTLYTNCEPCLMCSTVIAQFGIPRVVVAARASDVPGSRPVLGLGLPGVAAWQNRQPDWPAVEVMQDLRREEAVRIIRAFPWEAPWDAA